MTQGNGIPFDGRSSPNSSTWNLTPPAIALTGVSLGGQGALRLAFKHPRTFYVVAAIASFVTPRRRKTER